MTLNSQRELEKTREKLQLLERMVVDARTDTTGDAEVRAAELESLQRQIKQLKEQIARYEVRQPAPR